MLLCIFVGLGQSMWNKLIEIQQQTLCLTQLVNRHLSASGPECYNSKSHSLPDDVDLPLNSVKGLESLEEKLKTMAVRKSVTNYLSQIGGLSVGDNTRRVLSALFTSDLARQMTMHGSSQKYAFKETHLYGILLDAVRRNPLFNPEIATDSAIQKTTGIWFYNARDRKGGRLTRASLLLKKNIRKD